MLPETENENPALSHLLSNEFFCLSGAPELSSLPPKRQRDINEYSIWALRHADPYAYAHDTRLRLSLGIFDCIRRPK